MYIVQPAWLAKIHVFPKDAQVSIYSKLDEPGVVFQSRTIGCRWFVSPSRIEVSTEKADEDCGKGVATVLNQLPWTPLVALGNNVTFTTPIRELERLPEEFRRQPEAPQGFDLSQRSFQFAASREGTIFNLQLSVSGDEIEISVNAHYELRNRDSSDAQQAASRFLQDRGTSESLMQHFLKASVEYGNPKPK